MVISAWLKRGIDPGRSMSWIDPIHALATGLHHQAMPCRQLLTTQTKMLLHSHRLGELGL